MICMAYDVILQKYINIENIIIFEFFFIFIFVVVILVQFCIIIVKNSKYFKKQIISFGDHFLLCHRYRVYPFITKLSLGQM